jgi:hypothetical protein
MPFITDRNKLKLNWEKERNNRIRKREIEIHNNVINNALNYYKPTQHNFKKAINITQDWQIMTLEIDENETSDITHQYLSWDITFEQIDRRLLPFIKNQVIYSQIENQPNDNVTLRTPKIITFFEEEPIKTSEVLVKAIMHTVFSFGNNEVAPYTTTYYKAKLIVNLFNPNQYT